MSIAISANIVPSRSLLLMVCGMCALASTAGIYAALSSDLHWLLQLVLILIACLCPLYAFLRFLQTRLPARLDISAAGEIILRKPAVASSVFSFRPRAQVGEQCSFAVSLAENATLWPNFLLLNLRSDDGVLHILPILWDSVQPATFKALSVALRWISVREVRQKGDFL